MTAEPARISAGRLDTEAAGACLSGLFEEHGRMVYGLCRLLLRDGDEAEDAAQQVFLSAHRSMLSGTEPRNPGAWLGTIARNECADRIRARAVAPLVLMDEREPAPGDLEHVAAQRAEIEVLCAALAELPQQQRQAVVLREFYGLSYDEVRDALGVTESAVQSLLFRARKRLQEELRPARVASGALALPLALRDAIAGTVPGFSSGSSGGMLGKLASLPFAAKLIAAAATVTAAGTIGYAKLDARDHVPAASLRGPAAELAKHRPAKSPVRLARATPERSAERARVIGGSEEEKRDATDERQASNQGEDVVSPSADENDLANSAGESGPGSSDSGSGSGDTGETGAGSNDSASGDGGD